MLEINTVFPAVLSSGLTVMLLYETSRDLFVMPDANAAVNTAPIYRPGK